jgi:hypothetical protein
MTPAFKHRHLKELYPTFWSKTVELLRSLQRHRASNTEKSVIEIDDWVSRGTLDAIYCDAESQGRTSIGREGGWWVVRSPDADWSAHRQTEISTRPQRYTVSHI